jgi:hypothetical protein
VRWNARVPCGVRGWGRWFQGSRNSDRSITLSTFHQALRSEYLFMKMPSVWIPYCLRQTVCIPYCPFPILPIQPRRFFLFSYLYFIIPAAWRIRIVTTTSILTIMNTLMMRITNILINMVAFKYLERHGYEPSLASPSVSSSPR